MIKATVLLYILSVSLVCCRGSTVGIVLVGRNDVSSSSAYQSLNNGLQQVITSSYPSLKPYIAVVTDILSVDGILANFTSVGVTDVILIGHSMTGGANDLQTYAPTVSTVNIKGVVLLAGFLLRTTRPDITACLQKASVQPEISFSYPLGYLQDGAHDCYGPNIPHYPIDTLTIGGELDGVVRMTRIAEAYYTQINLGNMRTQHPVVIVPGLDHSCILDSIPQKVSQNDLKCELTASEAIKTVSTIITEFIGRQFSLNNGAQIDALVTQTGKMLEPVFTAFVNLEGNWFFTGGDDEHGSSSWAAKAQTYMADPLPSTYNWDVHNEFHLLSDEEDIPPYYRARHRPQVNVSGSDLSSSTVTQLRFLEVSLVDVDAGLNGWGIIKEEKLNILTANIDDGSIYESAIEIATKIMSRQKVFNITGHDSPDSLDNGNRCAAINQVAYNWALSQLSNSSSFRWNLYGIPMVMGADLAPFPDAGPFWIWTYMSYTQSAGTLSVVAPYAFFSLSADPYGAGNHYCKLLSPARALEWLLIDGLRTNYGI